MWSHYANSHAGFCVGLDKFILWDIIQGSLGRAIYDEKFPTIGIFDHTVGTLTKILSTKSLEWEYEDEYRFVKINASRQVFHFPNEAVLEIILGHNMGEKYKDEIMNIANQKFPKAKIFQSQIDLGKFKLNMIPIIR